MTADQLRNPAADPAVDLVEHHHRQPSTGGDKNTKAYPRLLSAGRGTGERGRRVARIDADPEHHVVDSGGAFLPRPADRHRKLSTVEPELAHARRHLAGQALGGGGPALAESLRRRPVRGPGRGPCFLELTDPRFAGLERVELGAQGGEPAGKLVRRYPVLAPRVVKGGEPVLDGGEPRRVGVDVLREGADRRARLGHVHERRLEELAGVVRRTRYPPLDVGEPGEGAVHGGAGGVLAARERAFDLVRPAPNLDRVREAPQLPGKLGRLAGLRTERVELGALEGEVVDTAFALRAVERPGGVEIGVDRAEAAVEVCGPGDQLRVPGRRVEDPKLLGGPEKGVVGVLSLQVHEPGAERAQGPRRDRGIVDPAA